MLQITYPDPDPDPATLHGEPHNHKMAAPFSCERSDCRCLGQLYLTNNCVF